MTAIELDAEAVARFRERLRAPSRAVAGRVEDHLASALPADVVLLNPPRTGVDARVTDALAAGGRGAARDHLRQLRSRRRWRATSRACRATGWPASRAYDMFPQTAHVETVCELVPEAA